MGDLHLLAILPNVQKLDDIGMLDEFKDGHLALNGEGHPANTAIRTDNRPAVVDTVQVCQTSGLVEMGRALCNDLDSDQVLADTMSSKADTGRGAFP